MILDRIRLFPLGYSEVHYQKRRYGVTKQEFIGGKGLKIYAKELGGKNFISLNYYITNTSESLKPCEMSHLEIPI